jgi:hypothetical protein
MDEPTKPPSMITMPIFMSTFARRRCAKNPEKEAAIIWLAELDTATAGGTPISINRGVIKKPPPTPNMPDRTPVMPPKNNIRNMLTGISAIGRYIYIIFPAMCYIYLGKRIINI